MKLYNIVKVYTSTTGTGTVTLGSAVPSFLTFSGAGVTNGSTVSYAIEDGSQREVGTGVYNSGTQTLTRSVITSTNSNNAIPLSGAGVVFITGIASDLVTGAADLSTVGAIPYVSASGGILNQDATALFWDAANDRLGVRTNSPAGPLHIVGASSLGTRQLRMQTSGQTGYWDFYVDFANSNSDLFIRPNNDSSASATTNINASGNWSIGSLSSSTFKLDVAASGSAGTARFYGGSGVSNSTKVVVQAGAGQGINAIQEWQSSDGTVRSVVNNAGGFTAFNRYFLAMDAGGNSNLALLDSNGVGLVSSRTVRWSSTSSDAFSSYDLSLSRASAGVLQVGDGGSNANGTVNAKIANFLSADSSATTFTTGIASQRVQFYFDSVVPRSSLLFQNGRFEIYDQTSAITRLFIQATTGNISIGGVNNPSDPNFKLDIASSGSSGTLRVYDQTASIGVTKAVIRAGAGQSTTNLMEWQAANGVVRASVGSVGDFIGSSYDNGGTWEAGSSLNRLSNTYRVQWSSTGSYAGAADLSLSRASAGVLQVGDGGSNANGQVSARAVNAVSSLAAFNSTGGIYMSGNAGSSWGTIQSYSDGSGTAKATAINPTGGNLLIGTTTDDATNKLQISGSSNGLKINFTDQTATGGTTISEASTERAYLQWVGSTFATTNRRQQIELINLLGGISFWTASSEKARFAGSTGNLLIGTTTDDGSNKLQVSGSARVLSAGIATLKVDGGTTQGQWATGTGFSSIGTVTNDPLVFYTNNVNAARFAPTTGNLLVGTSTDLGYGLHAANKGTNGNLLVFDPTATTGTTKAVFKEGAGQSTTASTEWQDSAGAFTARVQAGGGFQSKVAYSVIDSGATVNHIGLYTTGLSIASGKPIAFSATTEATATKDLSLSRASAGVLQVGDGGSNANGTLLASGIGLGVSPLSLASYRVLDMDGASGSLISLRQSGTSYAYIYANSAALTIDSRQNTSLKILTGGAEQITVSNLGVTTLYNSTPTGVTRAVIRAGAGQSTTNLTEWQNSGGSQVAAIQSNGDFVSGNVTANTAFNVGAAGSPVRFWGGSSNDVAIRRRSDGLIGIDNNTAIGTTPGNARDVMARGFYAAETTSDPAAGDLTIAGSNAQDTFRLYMKNDKLVVAYNRSGTVNFLTIPLDGSTTTWTQSTTAP